MPPNAISPPDLLAYFIISRRPNRDLAGRLARREDRSIADVVERALETYEIREAGREPASVFYARLANAYGSDIDLGAVIREHWEVNPRPEL